MPARIPPPELTIGIIELAFFEPGGGIAKRSIINKFAFLKVKLANDILVK